jgi:hypothetical protein
MIDQFRASFTNDLAKPSRFKVKILAAPEAVRGIISGETLSFRCESASLPGRNISTADIRIYGPTEKYPYQTSYDDMTLTFICSDTMVEKVFFDQWMEFINPQDNWNFEYKSKYKTDITIEQYDNMGEISHTIQLIDAFPISMNELGLDWSNGDSYHKLSVSFAYTYWTRKLTTNGYEPEILSTDQQFINEIPSLLSSPDSLAQRRGTFLNVSNQSIGPFDTIKDQEASRVNSIKNSI